MEKLKILQIIDSLDIGGAEVLSINIANGLIFKNVDSHICVTRKEGGLKNNINENIGYLFLNRKLIIDINAIIILKKYIKKNTIGIIHAHSTSYFVAFCLKLIYPKIIIIWHDHYGKSEFLKSRKLYPLKFMSYFFHYIISVNSSLEKWSKDNLLTQNVSYLSNFSHFSNIKKVTKLEGLEGKRIVHLAGFREQKDHLTLLKAFNDVLKTNADWTLHLIGKEYKNNYSRSIRDYVKKNNLERKIFFYGVCHDIKHILSQASIGVLSSKSEGLPISLLEYGLAKLPVLVTKVGDCGIVVSRKEQLVEPNNPSDFSLKLKNLIKNEKLREVLADNLYKKVKLEFNKEKYLNSLIDIYKKC
ncbi:glycosyltransferase involved in cell wall biosynthesis [Lutibacter sp. Hel_I_33_5]|uniref:glycosyltransferase family 4 protein n=1 Tax=Lutibacter sp. Hel_I_33_5 TaxID=1566289 RepID=UPI0011A4C31E|nr:glycosyltransferase family 4 protein [Lutibacter sp. Hel_I_33_5]TVZ54869.1 glycosyltransferase involved in cell wall biosynthesis [Lutibacter sp. Hel_I_33_5]